MAAGGQTNQAEGMLNQKLIEAVWNPNIVP